MNLFESLMNENRKVSKKRVKESTDDSIRVRQLRHNIEGLVGEYYNSIQDGVWEPFSTTDDMVDWIYSQVFDIKDSGNGFTRYGKGICDDLKYLGKDFIVNEIIELGQDLLSEDVVTESKKVSESVDDKGFESYAIVSRERGFETFDTFYEFYQTLQEILGDDEYTLKDLSTFEPDQANRFGAVKNVDYFTGIQTAAYLPLEEGKRVTEANEPYFGSSKYEYDEDSEDDRITYDVISEHLSAMFNDIGVDPQYVGQLSRFERVMSDLIYLYKAYKDE